MSTTQHDLCTDIWLVNDFCFLMDGRRNWRRR